MRKLLFVILLGVLGLILWYHAFKRGTTRSALASSCSIPNIICGIQIPEQAQPTLKLERGDNWLEEPLHSFITGSVFRTMRCTYNVGDRCVNGVQLRRVFDCSESVDEQKIAYAEVMREVDSLVVGRTVLKDERHSSEWGESRDISCGDNLHIYIYLNRDMDEGVAQMGLTVSVPYKRM